METVTSVREDRVPALWSHAPQPAVNQQTHFRNRGRGQGGGADTISVPQCCNCRSANCCRKMPRLWNPTKNARRGYNEGPGVSLCKQKSKTWGTNLAHHQLNRLELRNTASIVVFKSLINFATFRRVLTITRYYFLHKQWREILILFVDALLFLLSAFGSALISGLNSNVACLIPQLWFSGCHLTSSGSSDVNRGGLGRVTTAKHTQFDGRLSSLLHLIHRRYSSDIRLKFEGGKKLLSNNETFF